MSDLLRDCNSGSVKTDPKTFRDTWCARCSRKECDLAMFAQSDPMAVRNATWHDKFFGTPEADLTLPKFAQIARLDFPNLLQKAMRLEVSERRGDWSVPEIPVLDGQVLSAPQATTAHVDDAVRVLAGRTPRSAPPPPPLEEDDVAEGEDIEEEDIEEPEPLPVPPVHIPKKVPPQPAGRNTADPGEVMIGGALAPATQQRGRPSAESDPWAPAPKAAVTVVKSGAKIQFGTGGQVKVTDGKTR